MRSEHVRKTHRPYARKVDLPRTRTCMLCSRICKSGCLESSFQGYWQSWIVEVSQMVGRKLRDQQEDNIPGVHDLDHL